MKIKQLINFLLALTIAVSIMAYRESDNPEASIWDISVFVGFLIFALIVNSAHDGRSLQDHIDEIKRHGR
jgi:hypothetical protein